MMRSIFVGVLSLSFALNALAQFRYPASPGAYRIYYADSVDGQIRTSVISFSPTDDSAAVYQHVSLYAANSPSGLTSSGEYLYWIETGSSVYRGRKDGSEGKVQLVSGLGGYAEDLIIRGGALYITDAYQPGGYGTLSTDLSGNVLRTVYAGANNPNGIERAAMNYLVRDSGNRILSYSFATGATQHLSTVGAGGIDITVADTNLVWTESNGSLVFALKRSLGGGGTSTILYTGGGNEVRYMDALDNRIFFGFISAGGSYLGTVGVRGTMGANQGRPQSLFINAGIGIRGLVVERNNLTKNDFDGDGIADRSVYYPATGQWYIFGTATGFYTDQFGYPGTIPVPGDYDGDSITDYGVFNPASGVWQLFRSSLGYTTTTFGGAGMMPSISDYDNDGKSDICLYNPPTGRWYIRGSLRGDFEDQFGNAFMIPVDTQTKPQY